MKKQGFTHGKRRIYYIEAKGKDISFSRWRVELFYAPHYAETFFLADKEAYNNFIENHNAHTYATYQDFRIDAETNRLRDIY
jgi:hypothetical protein